MEQVHIHNRILLFASSASNLSKNTGGGKSRLLGLCPGTSTFASSAGSCFHRIAQNPRLPPKHYKVYKPLQARGTKGETQNNVNVTELSLICGCLTAREGYKI